MQNTMQAFSAAADADFDFQMPCRYFKSSFARSLSLNNNNNNNNSGSGGNGNGKKSPQQIPISAIEAKHQQHQQGEEEEGAMELQSPCLTPPPALPARRHTSSNGNNLTHFNTASANQLQSPLQQQQQQQQQKRNLNLSVAWSLQDAAPNHNHNHYNNLPQHQQQQQQPPHEQQSLNVEAVILQNQVDTLQWQLKQTETNCEMYRAAMEEVARFLERYQQQQQQQQQQHQQLLQQQQHLQRQQQLQANRHSLGGGGGEQISRSKSLHHVQGGVQSDPNGYTETMAKQPASSATASYLRARSSTNLMLNQSMLTMNEDHNYESIAPAGSYNAFKDFTWRRSPKKFGGCKARLSSPEAAEEKLNQEAFRLARTIRNLLHTSQQQPDLTQPRYSMAAGRLCMTQKTSSVLTLHNATMDATPSPTLTAVKSNANTTATATATPTSTATAEMLFLRANTMRDSRLSLRSSTDSSVHSTISSTASSTSSSKLETDEEITALTAANSSTCSSSSCSNSNKPTGNNHNGSSTEDESGFSSISSFHDVGLPLSSTLIADNSSRRLSMSTESRNSTLKSALNVVGVPLQPQLSPASGSCSLSSQSPMQSPAKTYRNANRYQRFSTLSNEDAAAVLWV